MFEALIVLVLLGGLGASFFLGWEALLVLGAWLVAIGLGVGVPTGLAYHWVLFRILAPRGDLDARWWWSPVRLHRKLDGGELARVTPWFHAGAAGFVATVLGCLLAGVGLAKSFFL